MRGGGRQRSLHKGMGKSHFGTIHGSVADTLDEGEIVGILRIEDDLIDRSL